MYCFSRWFHRSLVLLDLGLFFFFVLILFPVYFICFLDLLCWFYVACTTYLFIVLTSYQLKLFETLNPVVWIATLQVFSFTCFLPVPLSPWIWFRCNEASCQIYPMNGQLQPCTRAPLSELHWKAFFSELKMVGGRPFPHCCNSHSNMSCVLFIKSSAFHWKGKVGGDNDMEVCVVISPAQLSRQPQFQAFASQKTQSRQSSPDQLLQMWAFTFFSSTLFMWNRLWEPSPRSTPSAYMGIIWLENKSN